MLTRLMFSGLRGGGTNPVMTLTATFRGGHQQTGFLIFGGTPQPNGVFIKGKKYNIANLLTQWFLEDYTATSVLNFENNALPCNSLQFDINGTKHTFTKQDKYYATTDGIFEEGQTYTIKLLSTT